MLIEFAKDKDLVGEMKIQCNTPDLVADLPHEFLLFMQHLQTLRYADRPNYSYLHSLMDDLFRKIGGDDATPFDWERVPTRAPRPRYDDDDDFVLPPLQFNRY